LEIAINEITREGLAKAVARKITDQSIRRSMGLREGEQFPEEIEWTILKNLTKKVRKFRYEIWFEIDNEFKTRPSNVKRLKTFFERLFIDSTIKSSFKSHKRPIPSFVDISLILYSKHAVLPLVSNDAHITEFRNELKAEGYTHEIFPLMALAT